MIRTLALLASLAFVACSDSNFAGVAGGDPKKKEEAPKGEAQDPGDAQDVETTNGESVDSEDLGPGTADESQSDTTGGVGTDGDKTEDDPGLFEDGENSLKKYTIPKELTVFYKKFKGSNNYYGKVQSDGKDGGAFYQVGCPGNSPISEGTATVRFNVKVGDTWTKFAPGDVVPLDPKDPILAKIEFDFKSPGGVTDHHHADDATIDIRSYFGPHPEYPDVSIEITTPGSGTDWPVGIGRGKDATRHPAQPNKTYKDPVPNCS